MPTGRLPVQPLRGTEAALAANVNTLERDEVAVATDTGRIYLVVPAAGGTGNALQQLAPGGTSGPLPSYGNTFLKENLLQTPIPVVGTRAIVVGNTQFKGLSNNFAHDPTQTNGHTYTGLTPILTRTICSASVAVAGQNNKIGFYLCVNRAGTPIAETDRFTETEVYVFASQGRNEAATIQMLEMLYPGDRVYLRIQNDTVAAPITCNFFNLVTISI